MQLCTTSLGRYAHVTEGKTKPYVCKMTKIQVVQMTCQMIHWCVRSTVTRQLDHECAATDPLSMEIDTGVYNI